MIDLSVLKALDFPQKEVKIKVAGSEIIFNIQALDDEISMRIALLNENGNLTTDGMIAAQRLVLKNGIVGIEDEQIDLLCKKALPSAMQLVNEIKDLTMEFANIRKDTADEAKKN